MSSQYNVRYEDATAFANADLLLDYSSATELDPELHIVFVGKDPAIADLYGQKLELDGYRMTIVGSQAEACQAVVRLTPDIIYLDMTESPSWGTQVVQAIRNDPASATTPIVLLVNTLRTEPVALGRHDFLIPVPDVDPELNRASRVRSGKLNS
jgi:CheY-like chemotaxis protein